MSEVVLHPFASPSKGALIDANLLIMLIIGTLGNGEVEIFKRTRQYTTEDVVKLRELLSCFGWLSATPQVIAETCNILELRLILTMPGNSIRTMAIRTTTIRPMRIILGRFALENDVY